VLQRSYSLEQVYAVAYLGLCKAARVEREGARVEAPMGLVRGSGERAVPPSPEIFQFSE